jgi:hypothetical protein
LILNISKPFFLPKKAAESIKLSVSYGNERDGARQEEKTLFVFPFSFFAKRRGAYKKWGKEVLRALSQTLFPSLHR